MMRQQHSELLLVLSVGPLMACAWQVLLCLPEGTATEPVYASSWWDAARVFEYLNISCPIWKACAQATSSCTETFSRSIVVSLPTWKSERHHFATTSAFSPYSLCLSLAATDALLSWSVQPEGTAHTASWKLYSISTSRVGQWPWGNVQLQKCPQWPKSDSSAWLALLGNASSFGGQC